MEKLSLAYTGIGSLPFSDENAPLRAMDFVFECCPDFPFWAQLPHFKKEEDMVLQFSQNLPGLTLEVGKFYIDDESNEFFEGLEQVFEDYEIVTNSDTLIENEEILDKYKITKPYSNTLEIFIEKLKTVNPNFIKGSVTGPFTFATSINDKYGKLAYYNETLRELIAKFLSLKALYQIKEFQKASPESKSVIFMDEPSISQVGSCAFVTVKRKDVTEILNTISYGIKKFGALTGIHCCGKTDWDIAIDSDVDIINFDAFSYSQSIGTFAGELEKFMKQGGFLCFGIVPTLDKDALSKLDTQSLLEKFKSSIKCFTQKGIEESLILSRCFISPSCGCGSLSDDMAIKALNLTKELSKIMKEETK